MIQINVILNCFDRNYLQIKYKRETISEYEVNFTVQYCYFKKIVEKFKNALLLNHGYDIRIDIYTDDETLTLSVDNLDNYMDVIHNMSLFFSDSENINMKLILQKEKIDGYIPIIDIDVFCKWLKELNVFNRLKIFSEIIKIDERQIIWIDGLNNSFYTQTVLFTSNTSEEIDYNLQIDKPRLIEQTQQVSKIDAFNGFNLLPQDFDIIRGRECAPEVLVDIFDYLKNFLSLCYICDYVYLKDNTSELRILSSRSFSFKSEAINEIAFDRNKYINNVYNWVYAEGNIIDRAILVKTVICSTINNRNIEDLIDCIDESFYDDVLSNFKLYLHKNLDVYIKLKHDAADKIASVYDSVLQIRRGINRNFTQSMFSIFAFIITIYITKSATVNANILSMNNAILLYIIILINIAYGIIGLRSALFEIKIIKSTIGELTQHYDDIIIVKENSMQGIYKKIKKVKNYIWTIWTISFSLLLILAIILNNFSDLVIIQCLDFFK